MSFLYKKKNQIDIRDKIVDYFSIIVLKCFSVRIWIFRVLGFRNDPKQDFRVRIGHTTTRAGLSYYDAPTCIAFSVAVYKEQIPTLM